MISQRFSFWMGDDEKVFIPDSPHYKFAGGRRGGPSFGGGGILGGQVSPSFLRWAGRFTKEDRPRLDIVG
jgi:hypothetical protein